VSKGRARIVVRLTDDEMKMVQAAADVVQMDIKHLARMGVLKEVVDIRTKLITKLHQEKEARDKAAREAESGDTVQTGESQGVSSSTLDSSAEGSNHTGA
jgi:hypothetical protein